MDGLIDLDDGSNFKNILTQMCKALKITVHILTERNAKGLTVEQNSSIII